MRFATAISDASELDAAVEAACAQLIAALGGAVADLVIVALTPHHAGRWAGVDERLRARLGAALAAGAPLLGCSAPGVIGDGHEVEQRAGLAIFAAALPGVVARAFRVEAGHSGGEDVVAAVAVQAVGAAAAACREALAARVADGAGSDAAGDACEAALLFADPTRGADEALYGAIAAALPAATLAGVEIGGGAFSGGTALFPAAGAPVAVGVVLVGALRCRLVLAQGCRPIGAPHLVSRCVGATVELLDGQRPVEVLRALYESLEPSARAQFRAALRVGVELDPGRVTHDPAAMRIRPLRGVDAETGALLLPLRIEPWQVVQFHVRDAHHAGAALAAALAAAASGSTAAAPTAEVAEAPEVSAGDGSGAGDGAADVDRSPDPSRGAFLVTGAGRGLALFGRPDHDTDLVRDALPATPIGGCFAAGAIVGEAGHAYLHLDAALVALFEAPAATSSSSASQRTCAAPSSSAVSSFSDSGAK